MVWAGICLGARTALHIVSRGKLTAKKYAEDILQEYIVLFASFIGVHFLLLHDNATQHTAQVVQQRYLQQVGIRLLAISARSPDMSPIEHVWDLLSKHVQAREHAPVSYTHLRAHETPEHLVCRLLLEKKNK